MFIETALDPLLNNHIERKNNHDWWASIAHILSMTSSIAPYAYQNDIGVCYIGSSYVDGHETFDANNEKLINLIRFCSCHFESVDGSVDRLGKADKIIQFHENTGINLQLKVCWNRTAGKNCSHCEKCYRTIMDIAANHGDPNEYGFNVTSETYKDIRKLLNNNIVNAAFWVPIVDRFKSDSDYWKDNKDLAWVLHASVNSPAVYAKKIMKRIKGTR